MTKKKVAVKQTWWEGAAETSTAGQRRAFAPGPTRLAKNLVSGADGVTLCPSSRTFCLSPGDSPCRFALMPGCYRGCWGKPRDKRKSCRLPSHCSSLAPPGHPRSGGNGGPGLRPASRRGGCRPAWARREAGRAGGLCRPPGRPAARPRLWGPGLEPEPEPRPRPAAARPEARRKQVPWRRGAPPARAAWKHAGMVASPFPKHPFLPARLGFGQRGGRGSSAGTRRHRRRRQKTSVPPPALGPRCAPAARNARGSPLASLLRAERRGSAAFGVPADGAGCLPAGSRRWGFCSRFSRCSRGAGTELPVVFVPRRFLSLRDPSCSSPPPPRLVFLVV